MLAPHDGNDAVLPQADGLPSYLDDASDHLDLVAPCITPHDDDSALVLNDDDEAAHLPASPLQPLAALLQRPEPLTWVFAGTRLTGDATFGDGRLPGEWFAEEWRAESGRLTDLVIDATWPGCTLAILKSHLKSRVVRHRPEIAVLFIDAADSTGGIEELPQFERRLVAILSVLSEIGASAVLVQPALEASPAKIDREIFFEAVVGIAKERGAIHVTLPQRTSSGIRLKTPDSPARHAALDLCRHAVQVATQHCPT
ncbi:MAG TPA: hypothetical protein VM452_20455 [Caulifigura sp.]|jgi:hypothetical protein|nr:hypothetical protein [Caulifigura sp.]